MSSIEFTYIDKQNNAHTISAQEGESLMEIATANSIDGIDGDCGGCCACGTCRIELDPALLAHVAPMQDEEQGVLEFVEDDGRPARLGCQIRVTEEFRGKTIIVAT